MLYIVFFAAGILVGHVGQAFLDIINGYEREKGCNQNCNQGRGCICGQSKEAK